MSVQACPQGLAEACPQGLAREAVIPTIENSTAVSRSPIKPMPADLFKAMGVFVMTVAILYFGKEVLMPVTLALLLAFVLSPLVDLLRRLHIGRVPAILLGVMLAFGVILAVGGVIGAQIADLTADIPQYTTTVKAKVSTVKEFTVGRFARWADKLGPHDDAAPAQSASSPAAKNGKSGTAQPAPSPAATPAPAAQPASSPIDFAQHYLSPVLSPLATAAIVFVVAIFALLQREDLRNRAIRLIGSRDLHHTTSAIDDGVSRLSRYFITQLAINTCFGIVIGIGLLILGLPNPVLWGILAGLLRFVPYVGSIISALLPMALAAAVEPGWTMVLGTGALYFVAEMATGQIIEPLVYGHSTGLSPFSVVVAAIFWSWLWGPVGLILSTPLTLCLVVIGRHVKALEFLDILLGDRPALTPVESFYQRILAGDPNEAQDYAELLLTEVSLSGYYDEIVIKALKLAAADAKRGELNRDQIDQIKSTVDTIIDRLSEHPDRQPPAPKEKADQIDAEDESQSIPRHPTPESVSPRAGSLSEEWRHRPAVLCIAGRGPLDEPVAAMLAQLLGKHGMNASVVPFENTSRNRIGSLDGAGVAMACLCYLDLEGAPTHMRYLLQRIRPQLPAKTPILVGLRQDQTALQKADSHTGVGTDLFASTLARAVTECAQLAKASAMKPVAARKPALSQAKKRPSGKTSAA